VSLPVKRGPKLGMNYSGRAIFDSQILAVTRIKYQK
jgi:hypothetical protein